MGTHSTGLSDLVTWTSSCWKSLSARAKPLPQVAQTCSFRPSWTSLTWRRSLYSSEKSLEQFCKETSKVFIYQKASFISTLRMHEELTRCPLLKAWVCKVTIFNVFWKSFWKPFWKSFWKSHAKLLRCYKLSSKLQLSEQHYVWIQPVHLQDKWIFCQNEEPCELWDASSTETPYHIPGKRFHSRWRERSRDASRNLKCRATFDRIDDNSSLSSHT